MGHLHWECRILATGPQGKTLYSFAHSFPIDHYRVLRRVPYGIWKVKSLSCVWLFVTLWTIAYQAPPSMGFSRQGYWSGLPFPSPGDAPNPGIKPRSPSLQTDALPSELPGKPRKLEWAATSFSKRSSWPRDRTWVSCIAGRFFTIWAIREATMEYSRSLLSTLYIVVCILSNPISQFIPHYFLMGSISLDSIPSS